MQFRPVTSRGPFPIAIENGPEALSRSDMPDSYALVPRCQASTNDRGHATDGSSATFTRNRGPCRGSRTARGRASIRRPGRRGTPGWTTRAGAARACPRRHRTTPEIERGGRRPTRSASPRAVERTRDTDSGSPRRPSRSSARSTRPALPMLPRPRPVRRQRRAPGRGTTGRRGAPSWPGAPPPDLRVDLPDVDHGARVLGDRGEDRRVVEAPAGCPSPQRNCGARPPRTTTGEPLKCAVATPDTPLVPLGPAVRTGRRPGPTLGSRLGR